MSSITRPVTAVEGHHHRSACPEQVDHVMTTGTRARFTPVASAAWTVTAPAVVPIVRMAAWSSAGSGERAQPRADPTIDQPMGWSVGSAAGSVST